MDLRVDDKDRACNDRDRKNIDRGRCQKRGRDRARTASPVAGGPRGGAAISATRAGPRRHRREAGGQFRDGRPWHGAGAVGAESRRLAHRGHSQGRGDDTGRRLVFHYYAGGGETKAALSEIGANLAKLCWTSSISAGIICLFIFLLLFTV